MLRLGLPLSLRFLHLSPGFRLRLDRRLLQFPAVKRGLQRILLLFLLLALFLFSHLLLLLPLVLLFLLLPLRPISLFPLAFLRTSRWEFCDPIAFPTSSSF